MQRSRRRTKEEMYPLVESYIQGRESLSVFCQRHDLLESALKYWHTKYRKAHGLSSRKNRSNFVSVEVSAPRSSSGVVMELAIGKGKLKFYSYPEAKYLQALLDLEGC